MNAVDTNVLARFILRDDPDQYRQAAAVMREGAFVTLTVLVETAWLLASRYRQPRTAVAAALQTIASMPDVVVEAANHLDWAIARFEAGADIADVIHLVAARDMAAFMTFDRALGRVGEGGPVAVGVLS